MTYPADGIVLIDKEAGITSHDVVQKVRSTFKRGKAWKVGHAGTLDPFATGLLIVLMGQGTRLSDYLMAGTKAYQAVMTLGVETDTLDGTGRIVSTQAVPDLSAAYIRQKATAFVGEIEQTPPVYSAIKIEGRRAYTLARNGVAVHMKSRTVTVWALDILEVDLPRINLCIRCSSGTYIRSLTADLGRLLGPGGHLTALKRIESGSFHVDDALCSKKICAQNRAVLRQRTLSLRTALSGMQEIQVDKGLAQKVRHGYQPTVDDLLLNSHGIQSEPGGGTDNRVRSIKLISQDKLVAVLTVHQTRGGCYDRVSIEKVFSD
ncbi:MAG: tRNA pseudouridine(55) synthase TruB [Desulfatiglandaceae bacterium]